MLATTFIAIGMYYSIKNISDCINRKKEVKILHYLFDNNIPIYSEKGKDVISDFKNKKSKIYLSIKKDRSLKSNGSVSIKNGKEVSIEISKSKKC